MLLKETLVLLSADLFEELYAVRGECKAVCQELVRLAERFEKELDWKGDDDERDYIVELEKFEDSIRKEIL